MRKIHFQSLTFKLTRWYILFLSITLFLAGLFLYQGFKDRLFNETDKILLEIADETNEIWREKRGVGWKEAIDQSEARYSKTAPFIQYVELQEKDEKRIQAVTRSDKIPEGAFLAGIDCYYKADRANIDDMVYRTLEDRALGSFPVRTLLFPVRGPNILQVGISLQDTYGDLNRMLALMILAGGLFLLLASVGGGIIINRALRPVKNVVRTARKISAENLSHRIEAKNRGDEIGELVETFNDMIIRLERAVKKIRQFSGDVSHELRTPLTIIRGEVEVLLRKERTREEYVGTLDSVLEESQRMEKIIDNLLFLSRTEGLDRCTLNQTVLLDEVTAGVAGSRVRTAEEKNLEIRTEGIRPARVKGSPELLERMIANLLDNAIRYTQPGGRVDVTVEETAGAARLVISDTGIGIPEEEQPKIFDRFYVVDPSRSKETGGTGLGLSIVKWIADSHGADIQINSRPGIGTTVTIIFPAA
ncbi:MAG: HAMP domain-containing protein [Acidobacteria bacterium]|nr:HAMP domain-containing protein [Acidobacteriota bacterium]